MLGAHVFVALSAIVWADGEVTPEERDGLMTAARACGVAGTDLEKVERSLRERVEVLSLDHATMTIDERLLVYGIGCWLMRADGDEDQAEWASIGRLGHQLGLTEEQRELASIASFSIEQAFAADARGSGLEAIARAIAEHPT